MNPQNSLTAAIAGNPNCGKTALFNLLTGANQKIANFPGVTVEKKEGFVRQSGDVSLKIIDLPGTYSLDAETPDEIIAQEILLGLRADTPQPDVILVVADATHLERSCFLLSQLMEHGLRLVLCLNMIDIAEKRGLTIDTALLAKLLGVPVVPTAAIKGRGREELLRALSNGGQLSTSRRPFALPEESERGRGDIAAELQREHGWSAARADFWAGRLMTGRWQQLPQLRSQLQAAYERWQPQLQTRIAPEALIKQEIEARHAWSQAVCRQTVADSQRRASFSDKLDKILLQPVLGPLIFLALMALVFQSVFSWASPLMDVLDGSIGWLADKLTVTMPESLWRELLTDGVLGGVGSVLIFIPQIMILFFFIGLLEDSGYLARAAFLVDRLMVRSGLSGKSFIPLLSSFACAIPGIMATRTIKDERDRLTTVLVAPLMTCSARLPVYTLLIGSFVPAVYFLGLRVQALLLFGLYMLGILGAVLVARVMRRTLLRGQRSFLVMELPDYKMPSLRNIMLHMRQRLKLFLLRAGGIILVLSIVLWGLVNFPRHDELAANLEAQGMSQTAVKARLMRESYAGKLGHLIEPLIEPLGFDWKVGIGLLASLAAREVFVATMGTLYSVQDADESSETLRTALQQDRRPSGDALFTLPMVAALLVFFAFAMQCVSTVAIIRRETNSWRWPLFAIFYTYLLAYVGGWLTYRVGNWFVG